jgi:hypothetical protein
VEKGIAWPAKGSARGAFSGSLLFSKKPEVNNYFDEKTDLSKMFYVHVSKTKLDLTEPFS